MPRHHRWPGFGGTAVPPTGGRSGAQARWIARGAMLLWKRAGPGRSLIQLLQGQHTRKLTWESGPQRVFIHWRTLARWDMHAYLSGAPRPASRSYRSSRCRRPAGRRQIEIAAQWNSHHWRTARHGNDEARRHVLPGGIGGGRGCLGFVRHSPWIAWCRVNPAAPCHRQQDWKNEKPWENWQGNPPEAFGGITCTPLDRWNCRRLKMVRPSERS